MNSNIDIVTMKNTLSEAHEALAGDTPQNDSQYTYAGARFSPSPALADKVVVFDGRDESGRSSGAQLVYFDESGRSSVVGRLYGGTPATDENNEEYVEFAADAPGFFLYYPLTNTVKINIQKLGEALRNAGFNL